jgi:glycosyltransferase involved in cell wall biosynthesis
MSKKIKVKNVREAEWGPDDNGNMTLKLDDIKTDEFPTVSIVTVTKDRRKLFSMAIHCWSMFVYPNNKIEWVILDDGKEDITDLIDELNDDRVRYIKCDPLAIGAKRNKAVMLAKYDIIINMDDDCYYFPDSVLAKVRIMKTYNAKCVYSHNLGVYDSKNNTSCILEDFRDVPEASMAFTRSFWSHRKFGKFVKGKERESDSLVCGKESKMVKICFWFNMITILHSSNSTSHLSIKTTKEAPNFYQLVFNPKVRKILDSWNI